MSARVTVEAHGGVACYTIPDGAALVVLDGGSVFLVQPEVVGSLIHEGRDLDCSFAVIQPDRQADDRASA